jgi:tRNA A-37 threonylcarbamoyl transferase component Bud32
MAADSLIGQLIGGRFQIVGVLGAGAMGEVYLAEHAGLGRRFAIKVVKECVQRDPVLVERFRREARAVSRLDHPNIVSINDFGQLDDGRFFLVMEHVPGQNLREVLQAAAPAKLPRERSLEILLQLAGAIGAAHEAGVVHRDLKPENLLLGTTRTGGDLIKVLDFGMAKIMATGELHPLTRKGEIFGTPAYMSPEQARGDAVDERTDIYALGAMMFELVTGRLPFAYGSVPRLLIAHQRERPPRPSDLLAPGEAPLPGELEALILGCLEKDPANRPGRAGLIARTIREHHQPIRAARTDTAVTRLPSRDLLEAGEQTFGGSTDAGTLGIMATLDGQAAEASLLLEMRVRAWAGAVKKARALGELLRDHRLGTVEVTQILGSLVDVEERAIALETELAVAESRLGELDQKVREGESRLRYAIIDLSMERSRLLDEGVSLGTVADLDYQIVELEGRLAELYRVRAEKQASLGEAITQRQAQLEVYRGRQIALEQHLIHLVRTARPSPCPAELRRAYDGLESLLRQAQGD